MNSERFEEFENRLALPLDDATRRDEVRRAELRSLAQDIIGEMKSEGKAMELTEEEERMLWSFRRFKLRMWKNGEVFRWQTSKPEGLVVAAETAQIIAPQEARSVEGN
jgi:hypothetical protein